MEDESQIAVNVRQGCICRNHGLLDADGVRIIDPCCLVHYAERIALTTPQDEETETTAVELAPWQGREKQSPRNPKLPKMKVAER